MAPTTVENLRAALRNGLRRSALQAPWHLSNHPNRRPKKYESWDHHGMMKVGIYKNKANICTDIRKYLYVHTTSDTIHPHKMDSRTAPKRTAADTLTRL